MNLEIEPEISDVIAEYLLLIDSGEFVDRESFVRRHPESAVQLQEFFEAEDQISSLSGGLETRQQRLPLPPATETSGVFQARETPVATLATSIASLPQLGTTIAAPELFQSRPESRPLRLPRDFEIIEEIAQGGMGVVYKARQYSLNRIVAVKVIRTDKYGGADSVRRFRAEAKLAASLQHPHIVKVHEVGELDGLHYFSMELIEGTSLAKQLSKGPLSAKQAAEYLETVARAIDYAHQQGVLHRDLKPANILLNKQLVPHVTDFGIARPVEGDSDLTATGEILGTPSYMSPEQTLGHKLHRTSDIYSLGAMLYTLLTARPPFQADTVVDTMLQVRTVEPVSPRLMNSTVPRDLDTICLKCLKKQPDRRYQSAGDLAADLRRFLDNKPILARPTGPIEKAVRWCQRNRTVASLIVLVALSLLGGTAVSSGLYLREADALADANTTLSRMYVKEARLDDPANMLRSLPWLTAALRLDEQNPERAAIGRLRIASILQASPSLEQMGFHDGAVNDVAAGPDGRRILSVSSDKTARVWDAITGRPVTESLVHTGMVSRGVFSHNGEYVATASTNALAHVWEVNTGKLLATLQHGMKPEQPELPALVEGICFQPPQADDPDRLVVATASFDHTARVWNARTGEELARLTHDDHVRHVLFDPTGRLLVTASADGTARIWDWTQPPETAEVLKHKDSVTALTISPDGKRVVTGTTSGRVDIWETATGKKLTEERIQHSATINDLACSSHGDYLASASTDGTVRLTWLLFGRPALDEPLLHPQRVQSVAFSPDSRSLVTACYDDALRVWNVRTGRLSLPLIPNGADSQRVAFVATEGKPLRLLSTGPSVMKLWQLPQPPVLHELPQQTPIRSLARATDVDRFLLSSKDRDHPLVVGDVDQAGNLSTQTLMVYHEQIGHQANILCATLSPDGKLVATGCGAGLAVVWNIETGQPLTPPLLHQLPVQHVKFGPDAQTVLVTTGKPKALGEVSCWDVADSDEPRWTIPGNIQHATYSPNGAYVAIAQEDSIRLLDSDTGKSLETVIRHDGEIRHCLFSPDSTLLATASRDGTARLWQIPSGEPRGPALQHFQSVLSVEFDHTGARLLTTEGFSSAGTARVWDVATGEPLSRRLPHHPDLHAASFSPEGRFLLTVGSRPATAYVWDLTTTELAVTPWFPPGGVQAAFLTHQGDHLITLHFREEKHVTRQWLQVVPISSEPRSLAELEAVAELLSSTRLDDVTDAVPSSTEETRNLWTQEQTD